MSIQQKLPVPPKFGENSLNIRMNICVEEK